MKKILFILLIFPTIGFAQIKYKEFKGSSGALSYNSQIVVEGSKKGRVYIDLNSDGLTSLQLDGEKERLALIEFLETTYAKFEEWEKTAKENNVTKKLTKVISSDRLGNGLVFKRYSSGDWYFNFNSVEISAGMFIPEGGDKISYYLRVPSVASYDNEYIESDAQVMIFDKSDISSLTDILTTQSVSTFNNEQNSVEDLFK